MDISSSVMLISKSKDSETTSGEGAFGRASSAVGEVAVWTSCNDFGGLDAASANSFDSVTMGLVAALCWNKIGLSFTSQDSLMIFCWVLASEHSG